MAWRPAESLVTLRNQLDTTYPGWLFLGFLGDAAHASVPSDHNPNAQGVVTALDIGGGGGLDIHALANRLAANPHPDLKYIISNRRIAEWQNGFQWRAYNGSDPHDTHIHVSVGRGEDGQSVPPYDDKNNWDVKEGGQDMPSYVDRDALTYLWRGFLDRDPTADEFKNFTDPDHPKTMPDVLHTVYVSDEYQKRKEAIKKYYDAWANQDGKVLDPGKYIVQ